MTAEIVIFNSEAVALAADSAATARIGNVDKISTSANKIFALSDFHPVGLMLYGCASFMGIPWETIVKYYRATALPANGFNTLEEYADDFISFLSYGNIAFHKTAESHYIGSFVITVLHDMRNYMVETCEKYIQKGNSLDDKVLGEISSAVIHNMFDNSRGRSRLLSKKQCKNIMNSYRKFINNRIDLLFGEFEINDDLRSKIHQIIENSFARFLLPDISCGIIITGFGEKDFVPYLRSYEIGGIVRYESGGKLIEKLMYKVERKVNRDVHVAIIPFAQQEMVYRYMEGVDPDYRKAEVGFVQGLLDDLTPKIIRQLKRYNKAEQDKIGEQINKYSKQAIAELEKNMDKFVQDYFSDPTVDAVSRLPKIELALMAESLVYLTSLKRKISQDPETVAEPIDVAVISKGDGFVWIKRKHYFNPELNPSFFKRKYKEMKNGETGNTTDKLPSAG